MVKLGIKVLIVLIETSKDLVSLEELNNFIVEERVIILKIVQNERQIWKLKVRW